MAKTTKKNPTHKSTKNNSNFVELPVLQHKIDDDELYDFNVDSIVIDKSKSQIHLIRFETSESGLTATCAAIIDGIPYHINLSFRDAYKLLFG